MGVRLTAGWVSALAKHHPPVCSANALDLEIRSLKEENVSLMELATQREEEINLLKDVKLHSLDGQQREKVLSRRVQQLTEQIRCGHYFVKRPVRT